MLDAEAVRAAIRRNPNRYETRDHRLVIGGLVSSAPRALLRAGWRKVSGLGQHELERMGLEIVEAQYVGDRTTGKFVPVVVVEWLP